MSDDLENLDLRVCAECEDDLAAEGSDVCERCEVMREMERTMTLPDAIASLELRLAGLPHQDYARQMVLDTIAVEVSRDYGGKAVILQHAACITIAGIAATGCDLAGATQNWISAARREEGK